jgi:peroxiredoxin
MEDVMSSSFHRDLMTAKLAPGEPAFLFELPTPDGEQVDIADFVGVRPVALVFGSYT